MSLFSVVNRFNLTSILSPSKLLFPKIGANEIVATDPTNAVGGVSMLLGGVRGKKKKMGGSTRNQCGFPHGRKRGLKIYDGQRVPIGKVLVDQMFAWVLPGWNVRFFSGNKLKATCHGRVMITTEKLDPDWTNEKYVQKNFGTKLRTENFFKQMVHVIPDKDHQYFKLVDQV